MPGLLDRSIDRELGIDDAPGAGGRRDSWLRDWPLLVGLVLSAGLIAASTTIGADHGPRRKPLAPPKEAAAAAAMPGSVVDVGESDAAPQPHAKAAKKGAKHSASARKSGSAAAPAHAAPAAKRHLASPTASGQPAATPRGHTTAPTTGGGTGTGGATKPGRIVNVTGTSASITNGPLSYAFAAPSHTPVVGKSWRLSIAVQRAGKPLGGNVKIDILHNGSVVGHAASGKLQGGRFAHDFDWPKESAGYPLTVKTTVVGGGFQQSFLFNVKVQSGA